LLIEGSRPGRERERYGAVLDASLSDRFLESGGCGEVLAKLRAVREVASETEQLRVGGFIDRDFRTDEQADALAAEHDVCVLPVHEVENFFLHDEALAAIAEQAGSSREEALRTLRDVADGLAGLWVWERTTQQKEWEGDFRAAQGTARKLTWQDLESDARSALQTVVDELPGLDSGEQMRRRAVLASSATEYGRIRQDPGELWKWCFGKEALRDIAKPLGFADGEAMEQRIVRMWQSGAVERPAEVNVLRAYRDAIPVLS
jgi:hypothetical protein